MQHTCDFVHISSQLLRAQQIQNSFLFMSTGVIKTRKLTIADNKLHRIYATVMRMHLHFNVNVRDEFANMSLHLVPQ